MFKETGWGRKAVERFKVDKEAQIEALRQIGIDVNLYQELERKATLEAEIRKATILQEQSSEGKYFHMMKPGKQVTPYEKELRSKISNITSLVATEKERFKELNDSISRMKQEIEDSWKKTNFDVRNCIADDERLETNGPRLANNCNKSVIHERLSLEALKTQITHDISLLEKECSEVGRRISWQKNHVEYIRNYERLGLPRDLRKIDLLENELRQLTLKDFSKHDLQKSEPEIHELTEKLLNHIDQMGFFYARHALKDLIPDGLCRLVRVNRDLVQEKAFLESQLKHLTSDTDDITIKVDSFPIKPKSAIVKKTLYPKFTSEKIFPELPVGRAPAIIFEEMVTDLETKSPELSSKKLPPILPAAC